MMNSPLETSIDIVSMSLQCLHCGALLLFHIFYVLHNVVNFSKTL